MALKHLQKSALILWLLASVLSGAFLGSSTWTTLGEQQLPVTPPVTVQPGVPNEIPEGVPAWVTPGETIHLVTPSGVQINVIVGESVEITVTSNRELPAQLPEEANATLLEGVASLDLYLSIELNDTETSMDAELNVPYTDEEVVAANIREETLVLHYWDPKAGLWMPIDNPGIDTVKNYVSGRTPHFSTWTILGESTEPTTATPAVSETGSLGILPALLGLMIGVSLLVAVRKRRRR